MNKFKRVTSMLSRSNWNLEVLVFEDKGKPGYPKKNLSEHGREPIANSAHIILSTKNIH